MSPGPTHPGPGALPGPDDPLWPPGPAPARPEPTRSGRRVFWLGLLVTLIGLVTRNLWLSLLGFGTISGPVVSTMLRPGLSPVLEFDTPRRAVVGQGAWFELRVLNRQRRSQPPLLLTCRTDGFEPVVLRVPGLGPGESGVLGIQLVPLRRGPSPRTLVRSESRAPLGLARRAAVTALEHDGLLVHPRRKPPERIDRFAGDGDRPAGRRDRDGGQPWSMREYRPGDPVRRVHWRSSARRGELVVVEPERTAGERVAVLAVGAADDAAWEDLLARAAWSVADLVARGGEVVLATAGDAIGTRDPATALDWFAALPPAAPPDPDDLRQRLHAVGGGDVLVLAPAAVPPGWWAMAQQVAASTGCRLTRGGP